MLPEIGIGDAYGMGFEFALETALTSRKNDGETYYHHPFHDIKPGHYTDDTQMSIAVAETLIAHGVNSTKIDFANAFVSTFKLDSRLGYSSRCYNALKWANSGLGLISMIDRNSIGSGAAMRAVPLGYIPDLLRLRTIAVEQASITHNTVSGMNAALAVAFMSHYAIYGLGSKTDLRKWLCKLLGSGFNFFDAPHEGQVPSDGIPSVNAALTVLEQSDTLTEILIRSVNFGGDVDTVAAIAMGIGCNLLPKSANDLSHKLYTGFEDGWCGMQYLQTIDTKLREAFQHG